MYTTITTYYYHVEYNEQWNFTVSPTGSLLNDCFFKMAGHRMDENPHYVESDKLDLFLTTISLVWMMTSAVLCTCKWSLKSIHAALFTSL